MNRLVHVVLPTSGVVGTTQIYQIPQNCYLKKLILNGYIRTTSNTWNSSSWQADFVTAQGESILNRIDDAFFSSISYKLKMLYQDQDSGLPGSYLNFLYCELDLDRGMMTNDIINQVTTVVTPAINAFSMRAILTMEQVF